MTGKSRFQIARSLDEKIRRILLGTDLDLDAEYSQATSAYILGFNYGNLTNCVCLTSNYQLKHAVFPIVGLVFFKLCPSDVDIKAKLESIKEFSSSPNGLGSFKSDKNEHLFLIYSLDKDCIDVDKRIFNFSKGSFAKRKRLRLSILDDPYSPRQPYPGSEDFFTIGDGDSFSSSDEDQVDHLIFFIHGVGGICDVRFRSCVEVVADFKKLANNLLAQQSGSSSGTSTPSNRHLANHLKKGFFRKQSSDSGASPSSDYTDFKPRSSRTRRIECLPISWHSCTRRQTGMNEQLNQIALNSVPKLRHFLNKVVMDALLYSSGPVYNQTIINNVGEEINRLYSIFMEKYPNFTGSVSLAGHSLGSVIVFDLLAHQIGSDGKIPNLIPEEQQLPSESSKTGQYLIKYPQLKFKPRCFFAFGSPMPMFLTVRGIKSISKDYKLPTCDRMFNIFHPYDPLAYRIEPLIDPRFKDLEPVLLSHHRGGKRTHVQLREGFAKVGHDIKHRLLGSLRDTWSSFRITSERNSEQATERSPSLDSSFECLNIFPNETTRIGKLNGGKRLDYVLQEKPIELFNEYIFAFTSHANYWQNEDSALIMLNEIYQADNIQLFDNLD